MNQFYGSTNQLDDVSDILSPKTAYPTLNKAFLETMEEIASYGADKYKDRDVNVKVRNGDYTRHERTKAREIGKHIAAHYDDYLDGVLHDHFETRKHNLAAVAINAMLEFMLAGFENGESK